MADISSGRLSKDVLNEVVRTLCNRFKVTSLYPDQLDALYNFLCGRDVFVNKPTGSGKSIIFQMAPFAEMALAECDHTKAWKKEAIVIVICPLVALMKDQVNCLQALGINAAYVGSDQSESVLQKIENGEYNLVFMSPESTLNTERWRSMVSNPIYSKSLMGIAVDEVHCVTQWGQSNSNHERLAFRKWYSQLNELRSLTDGVPFMALTATATTSTKKKIFSLLEMKKPYEVVTSPDRSNVTFVVQKMELKKCSLIDYFHCIISDLQLNGKHCTRTIVYCQTITQCSTLYNLLAKQLGNDMYLTDDQKPQERFIDMMHSQTPTNVKDHILQQFTQRDGHLRILIATIAFGMGVNCQGVQRVIHFGPSKIIEAYMQESGRCGRGGEESVAILLHNGMTTRTSDEHMKDYVNGEYACRRETLLQHFDGSATSKPSGHMCCDKCAQKCTCKGTFCDKTLYLQVGGGCNEMDATSNSRLVSNNQMEQLERRLRQMHKAIVLAEGGRAISHVTYPTTLMQFGECQIKQVLENCKKIFAVEDVLHYVEIWNKKHALSVLKIIRDVFQDVEDDIADSSSDADSDEEMSADVVPQHENVNDKSYLSLLDTSEWIADSSSSSLNEAAGDMPDILGVTDSVTDASNILEPEPMEM